MAQTVSGSAFCTAAIYAPPFASVDISGSVALTDVGLPGAVWVGIEDPAKPGYPAAFLTPSGWVTWTTGGFPAYVETQSMGPGFSHSACVPNSQYGSGCTSTSASFVGWKIYAGYGVLTPEHQALIAQRRASLDQAKPWLQQQGKWRPEYEDDVANRNALVQKSANDGRWGLALTVPYIDCTPPDSGS
ncbi:MAG: hypothetical protein RJA34_16 [Pseudomonadota bacterium]